MADESLVTLDQPRRLVEFGACHYLDIRLWKNGGADGSLRIARLPQEAGIKIQVGVQVDETGICRRRTNLRRALAGAGLYRRLVRYLAPR